MVRPRPGTYTRKCGQLGPFVRLQYVYYTTGGADPLALRVRLSDRKVEMITSLKDLPRATGPDGNTQIGVAPDGSAVFTRDIGTQEIYALTVKWP